MSGSTTIDVPSLSRAVIGQVAPAEGPALEIYLAAYREDPSITRSVEMAEDHDLGFGSGAFDSLVPQIVSVAATVVAVLSGQVVGALKLESESWIRAVIGRLFTRLRLSATTRPTSARIGELTGEQLAAVRLAALSKATELGIAKGRSAALADAIVGALVATDRASD